MQRRRGRTGQGGHEVVPPRRQLRLAQKDLVLQLRHGIPSGFAPASAAQRSAQAPDAGECRACGSGPRRSASRLLAQGLGESGRRQAKLPPGPRSVDAPTRREDAPAVATAQEKASVEESPRSTARVSTKYYERELVRLQVELVKQQEFIRAKGLRVVLIFEGRDAAGKGGAIQRITEPLNPRYARVVALPAPTDRERGQWYFQRYVPHLPARGEMVLFDRSWYNRAGVERVMGFCTDEEYWEFLRSCPEFERMLVRSGIQLIKYWFSVSDTEQERRFQQRLTDPTKRWKLSPMDLEARNRWVDFSRAKDAMLAATDIPEAPWWVVEAEVKKRARLNVINHLLTQVPYEDLTPEPPKLPPRPRVGGDYIRPPKESQHFVPDVVPG